MIKSAKSWRKSLKIIYDRRLIFRIHKEPPKLSNNNKNDPIKNGQKFEQTLLQRRYIDSNQHLKRYSLSFSHY